jgi:hypothetical protein
MPRQHMKQAIVGVWVLGWTVMALFLNVRSATAWILLIIAGVLPPLVLLRLWRPPAQTMSESIRDVLN